MLILLVDARRYAVAVDGVVEVVLMVAATHVPDAPDWVAGAINYRGRPIPLIDARARLGAPFEEPGLATPIVILDIGTEQAGLIVDEVVEVAPVPRDGWEPASDMAGATTDVARQGDELVLVLDPERLCDGAFAASAGVS